MSVWERGSGRHDGRISRQRVLNKDKQRIKHIFSHATMKEIGVDRPSFPLQLEFLPTTSLSLVDSLHQLEKESHARAPTSPHFPEL